MLSWQLASLMMAHSLKMAVTLGGSILCCGELVASSPKKLSNQLLKPPCSFASRSVLPPKAARPSLGTRIQAPTAPGSSDPAPAPYTRLPLTGDKSLTAYGDWSTGQLILSCSRSNRPMATVSRDVSCMQLTRPFPTLPAPKSTSEMSNVNLARVIWRRFLAGRQPASRRDMT
ncbi:uncharacterized protein N7479_006569 [Penicillium vulpinum]|uniref:uncharacterized protein n=1 Tax=Penicillium vulpinum TaxID=29845 RepID=UPI00254879DF|nr:uncharacterized protein N7479_006569 [Penicillium vulpinum]KAJ5959419.1 hypothetical protein N7479_006569 [Penicillium vulpinum]